MELDYARLGQAIRAACEAKGWLQEDLILHSEAGRSTIQRLWVGKAKVRPGRRTQSDLEECLGWGRGSVMAVLNGGDPTPISPMADSPPGYRAEVVTADGTTVPIALLKKLADLTPTELDEVMKHVEKVKARIENHT